MNIGEGVQAVEDLKFTEWFEQWQRLVLSGRDGQQHVVYSGGSSMGHVGQCPPKENVEMTFLHSN